MLLNGLRRGPATLARALRTARISSRPSTYPSSLRIASRFPSIPARSFHQSSRWRQLATAESVRDADIDEASPPVITEFQQLADEGLLDKRIVDTLTQSMSLTTLTPVQSMTINETLKGTDVLAQAKTGTGKTIGFLLPVLHNILKARPELISPQARNEASSADVIGLIISPTRELAEQIAAEARRLVRGTGIVVQSAVGGTQKFTSLRTMQRQGCHVLVGTPGRLKDIFSDRHSGVAAPDLNSFVLDEADRLMDQGFWPEIQAIQDLLPDPRTVDRQTMMFSATMDGNVIKLVRSIMKPDYQSVRTVQEGEQPTHERVPQRLVHVDGFENLMPSLLELCKREIEARRDGPAPFKAIVYFSSTAMVRLAATTFEHLKTTDSSTSSPSTSSSSFRNARSHPLHPARLVEMHARLSQGQRTRASEDFRRAKSAIMFSSDVTARGMDFPNVTHVIQVGCPTNRDDYIHRLGRTARGDKEGEGWLLAPAVERREVHHRLRGLPLQPDTSLQSARIDMSQPAQLPAQVAATLTQIGEAVRYVDREEKAKAYLAYLGVYASLPKQELVDAMNRLAKFGWGLPEAPGVPHGLAKKLGLLRVDGVVIQASANYEGGGGGGGGYGGGRGVGGRGGYGGGRGGDRGRGGYGGGKPSYGRGYGDAGDGADADADVDGQGGYDRPSRGGGRDRSSGYGGRRGDGYGEERSRPRAFEHRERRAY